MNGPDHYRAAEEALQLSRDPLVSNRYQRDRLVEQAKAHAMLAEIALRVDELAADARLSDMDRDAWLGATGHSWDSPS